MSSSNGGGDGGGDGGGGGLGKLRQYKDTLLAFGSSPAGFALGIVLTPLFEGLETIFEMVIDGIYLVFVGDSVGSTSGTVGIADIPLLAADVLIGVGDLVGSPVLDGVGWISTTAVEGMESLGIWGLILGAIVVMTLVYVLASNARLIYEIVLDVIPGGGALIN